MYSKWDFVVANFNFSDIKDTRVKTLLNDPEAVSQLNWNDFSILLKSVATSYYTELSPFWPEVPSTIRRDLAVGLVIAFPWLQKRFRHFKEKQANGEEVSGAHSSSLDFISLQVNSRFWHFLITVTNWDVWHSRICSSNVLTAVGMARSNPWKLKSNRLIIFSLIICIIFLFAVKCEYLFK